jgi:hypothetical protein
VLEDLLLEVDGPSTRYMMLSGPARRPTRSGSGRPASTEPRGLVDEPSLSSANTENDASRTQV